MLLLLSTISLILADKIENLTANECKRHNSGVFGIQAKTLLVCAGLYLSTNEIFCSKLTMKNYDVILTCDYSPWSDYTGGAQKSTHMIATELCNQGHSVCVVYSKGVFEDIVPPTVPYDIKWAFFFAIKPGISSIFRFLNGISFYRVTKKLSASKTIIHSNGEEGSLLGYLKKKKKFVYTNRYPDFNKYMSGKDWSKISTWINIAFRERRFVAMAMAIFNADVITCTSSHSIEQIHQCFGISKEKLHLVYNGIDPVFINSTPLLPSLQKGILFYGRLTQVKGVEELLGAYKKLDPDIREKHPLTIIGQGPLAKKLQNSAQGFPVRFLDWSDSAELIGHIRVSALVVLPSYAESFGNTMLETLALGQRLITSNKGSLAEVLGKWGHQLSDISSVSIRDAINSLLSEKPDPLIQSCQAHSIQSRFSWNRTVSNFITLYS